MYHMDQNSEKQTSINVQDQSTLHGTNCHTHRPRQRAIGSDPAEGRRAHDVPPVLGGADAEDVGVAAPRKGPVCRSIWAVQLKIYDEG